MPAVAPCLMFVGDQHGRAEEAMTFYVSVFDDSRVLSVDRYGAGEHDPEGTVRLARFVVAGRELVALDSGHPHAFTFTPAVSLFVDFDDPAALDKAFAQLSEGGAVLMEPGEYPFSPRFAWVQDRFGVSWQLHLPPRSPDGLAG